MLVNHSGAQLGRSAAGDPRVPGHAGAEHDRAGGGDAGRAGAPDDGGGPHGRGRRRGGRAGGQGHDPARGALPGGVRVLRPGAGHPDRPQRAEGEGPPGHRGTGKGGRGGLLRDVRGAEREGGGRPLAQVRRGRQTGHHARVRVRPRAGGRHRRGPAAPQPRVPRPGLGGHVQQGDGRDGPQPVRHGDVRPRGQGRKSGHDPPRGAQQDRRIPGIPDVGGCKEGH